MYCLLMGTQRHADCGIKRLLAWPALLPVLCHGYWKSIVYPLADGVVVLLLSYNSLSIASSHSSCHFHCICIYWWETVNHLSDLMTCHGSIICYRIPSAVYPEIFDRNEETESSSLLWSMAKLGVKFLAPPDPVAAGLVHYTSLAEWAWDGSSGICLDHSQNLLFEGLVAQINNPSRSQLPLQTAIGQG